MTHCRQPLSGLGTTPIKPRVAVEGRTNKGCVITLDIAFGQRVRPRKCLILRHVPWAFAFYNIGKLT